MCCEAWVTSLGDRQEPPAISLEAEIGWPWLCLVTDAVGDELAPESTPGRGKRLAAQRCPCS